MPAESTYPVQVLREHTVALEAALSVCLAEPAQKAVHRLRTESRRVEAQLLLLAQVPGLPEHSDEAAHLRRSLRRLRQAAGEIRDLDVQRKQLEAMASVPENPTLGSTQAAPPPSAAEPSTAGEAIAKGATALCEHLGRKRDEAAADLQKLLKRHQAKAARAAEALLKLLEDAPGTSLPASALLRRAEETFFRDSLPAKANVNTLREDDLHGLRKAAKVARYLAETLPGSADCAAAARRFEALQQAGGEWHDALELGRSAKRFLGKSHELTVAIYKDRDRNLALYRKALRVAQRRETPKDEPAGAGPGNSSPKASKKGLAKKRPALA